MKRNICVVTGSRAEYGLLRKLMTGIRESECMHLQIAVTGMHLSPEFGMTADTIEADGFEITEKIEVLLSADTPTAIAKAMGLGLIGFADMYARLHPNWIVVLGDRFEIFSAVAAALVARIPVAHLHGGELTEGAFDDSMRHSITKMSHLHFVAAETYRRRVIQLGENPESVFDVGGLGVDAMLTQSLLDRESLESSLGFKFGPRNLLITFHPVTLETATAANQMEQLLKALSDLRDTHFIFTMPNADTDGRVLMRMIDEFAAKHSGARFYTSLGQQRYWSCLRYVDAVIGNSSSGLTEVPTFRKATINIGDRQRGRLRAASVIDCEATSTAISQAIATAYSIEYQAGLESVRNPYGEGGASGKILRVLERWIHTGAEKKIFHDTVRNYLPP